MSRTGKDDIDRWFEYGINLSTKTLYIGSEVYQDDTGGESGVDHALSARVIKGLAILDAVKKEMPINILLNNPGGEVWHGLAIYDAIKNCQSQVFITVYGQAMSMASIILQAGDRRIIAPNATFMIHYGYDSHGMNHPKIIEKWVEYGKKINSNMEELYLTRITEKHKDFRRSKLQKLLDFDTILTAKETVELGLADEVLGEDE